MLAEIPPWIADAGSLATAIAAVIGAVILLSRLRPIKWLWRNLVSDPFTEWLHKAILTETASLRESMQVVQTELIEHMHVENELRREDLANRELRQLEHDSRYQENNTRFEALESGQNDILTRLAHSDRRQIVILRKLIESSPDIQLTDADLLEIDPPNASDS